MLRERRKSWADSANSSSTDGHLPSTSTNVVNSNVTEALRNLQDFAPSHLVDFIQEKDASTRVEKLPYAQGIQTVAMFLDLSGFTKLTERLAARGAEGAERLGFYLNRYFERLVKILFRSGGDVFKFAGDAMIILWVPETKEDGTLDLALMAAKAVQCSLQIHDEMHAAELAEGVEFSVKIGIGSGDAQIWHLGGVFERIENVVCGSALIQAFEGEARCEAGDTMVSPQTWVLIEDGFECEFVDGGFARVQKSTKRIRNVSNRRGVLETEEQLELLQQYIPAALKPFVYCNPLWLAELRPVSVLFINIGFDPKELVNASPGLLEKVQHVFRMVQRETYRLEGSINKFLLDDKGSTLLAVFGLPSIAHENDPARALALSLNLANGFTKYDPNHPLFMGITSGTVFCGPVGSGSRREYSVLGDKVNTAARFMQSAKKLESTLQRSNEFLGYILCDRQTRDLASAGHHEFVFNTMEPLKLKGKDTPMEAFQPGWLCQEKQRQRRLDRHYPVKSLALTKEVGAWETTHLDILFSYENFLYSNGRHPSTLICLGEAHCGKSSALNKFSLALQSEYGAVEYRFNGVSVTTRRPGTAADGPVSSVKALNPSIVIGASALFTRQEDDENAFVWTQVVQCLKEILEERQVPAVCEDFMELVNHTLLTPRKIPFESNLEWVSKDGGQPIPLINLKTVANSICGVIEAIIAHIGSVSLLLDDAQFMGKLDWEIAALVSSYFQVQQKDYAKMHEGKQDFDRIATNTKIVMTNPDTCEITSCFKGFFLVIGSWPLHELKYQNFFSGQNASYTDLVTSINNKLLVYAKLSIQDTEMYIRNLTSAKHVPEATTHYIWNVTRGERQFLRDAVKQLIHSQTLKTTFDPKTNEIRLESPKQNQFEEFLKVCKTPYLTRCIGSALDRLSTGDQVFLKCMSVLSRGCGPLGEFVDLGAMLAVYPLKDIRSYKSKTQSTKVAFKMVKHRPVVEVDRSLFEVFRMRLDRLINFGLIALTPRPKMNEFVEDEFIKDGRFVLDFQVAIGNEKEEKEDASILDSASMFDMRCIRFSNLIIRDTVYDRSSFAQRKRLHLSCASMFEQILNDFEDQKVDDDDDDDDDDDGFRLRAGRMESKYVRRLSIVSLVNHYQFGQEEMKAAEAFHAFDESERRWFSFDIAEESALSPNVDDHSSKGRTKRSASIWNSIRSPSAARGLGSVNRKSMMLASPSTGSLLRRRSLAPSSPVPSVSRPSIVESNDRPKTSSSSSTNKLEIPEVPAGKPRPIRPHVGNMRKNAHLKETIRDLDIMLKRQETEDKLALESDEKDESIRPVNSTKDVSKIAAKRFSLTDHDGWFAPQMEALQMNRSRGRGCFSWLGSCFGGIPKDKVSELDVAGSSANCGSKKFSLEEKFTPWKPQQMMMTWTARNGSRATETLGYFMKRSQVVPAVSSSVATTTTMTGVEPSKKPRQGKERHHLYHYASRAALHLLHQRCKVINTASDELFQFTNAIDSWDFDVFRFERFSRGQPLYLLCRLIFAMHGFQSAYNINDDQLDVFARNAEMGYPVNPYHNSLHATDVLQSTHVLLRTIEIDSVPQHKSGMRGTAILQSAQFVTALGGEEAGLISYENNEIQEKSRNNLFPEFTQTEKLALLLAAVLHDIRHPGVTAAFLVNSKNPVAMSYEAPQLERYHIATARPLLEELFANETPKVRMEVIENVSKLILSTALQFHNSFLNDMHASIGRFLGRKLVEPEVASSDRFRVLELVIKCADVGNCAKQLQLYKKWVVRIAEEFLNQGELEKRHGLPVSPGMGPFEPKGQLGFIDFIARPLYKTLTFLYPSTSYVYTNVQRNYAFWEQASKNKQRLNVRNSIDTKPELIDHKENKSKEENES